MATVQLRHFMIPAAGDDAAEEALNRFLRSCQVLDVREEFVPDGSGSVWSSAGWCIGYGPRWNWLGRVVPTILLGRFGTRGNTHSREEPRSGGFPEGDGYAMLWGGESAVYSASSRNCAHRARGDTGRANASGRSALAGRGRAHCPTSFEHSSPLTVLPSGALMPQRE